MGNLIDLTGRVFGDLTVLHRDMSIPRSANTHWICQCKCGNVTSIPRDSLLKRNRTDCGCKPIKGTLGGLSRWHLYHQWKSMIYRCEKETDDMYMYYGGRGIKVCERWHDIAKFKEDMDSTYKPGLQLDRIDNNKGYSPDNCRWVTPKENGRNKRNNVVITFNGETKHFADWFANDNGFWHKVQKHRLDGTMLIRGGKYDNTEFMESRGEYCQTS